MRTLHLVNRLLAVLLALAVVAATVLLAVEVVRWAMGEPPWVVPWGDWGERLTALRAGDREVLVAAGVAAAVGLLLLLFELKPRRPEALAAAPLGEGVETVTTRGGVRSAAVSAARGVSGVRAVSADVRRRRVDVTARTRARAVAPGLKEQVQQAVERAVADLELTRTPRVRVDVEEDG